MYELVFPFLALCCCVLECKRTTILVLSAFSLTALNSMFWPDDLVGWPSYTIDGVIFLICALKCRHLFLAVAMGAASVYNLTVSGTELALTSKHLALTAIQIATMDKVYEVYTEVMVLISTIILLLGFHSGLDAAHLDIDSDIHDLRADHTH